MRWAVVAVAVTALAVSTAGGAQARAVRPAGVTWNGIHFTQPTALASWLSARGIRYGDWVRRHPRGAYLMTHAAPASHRAVRATPRPLAAPELPPSKSHGLFVVFVVLAVILFALGAAGRRLVRFAQLPLELEQVSVARAGIAAGGAALAVGAALAWWF